MDQFDIGLLDAMAGGHTGLANFVTASEAGPMKGVSLRAVPSDDGKTVTYHQQNASGAPTILPLRTFWNDDYGVVQAAFLLFTAMDATARAEFSMARRAAQLTKQPNAPHAASPRLLQPLSATSKLLADQIAVANPGLGVVQ